MSQRSYNVVKISINSISSEYGSQKMMCMIPHIIIYGYDMIQTKFAEVLKDVFEPTLA